ncbi:hypothetical protein Nepgr_032631 [Nepenthes gracilis]|uniref:Uncharacterized protein n=1 Tax=Nepenthes gracilis TaxID=150966 RepID=A0AAD3TKU0_NEPGR|nr:hypothetical protein Nepgr_032631 [Nepenthes gracilis]
MTQWVELLVAVKKWIILGNWTRCRLSTEVLLSSSEVILIRGAAICRKENCPRCCGNRVLKLLPCCVLSCSELVPDDFASDLLMPDFILYTAAAGCYFCPMNRFDDWLLKASGRFGL